MNNSSIEWTDKTWNPVSGCSKVSAGCKNCYADAMFTRFKKQWGDFNDVKCHEDKLGEPYRLKKPSKIFINSMSDLFHEKVPFNFIDKVMDVIIDNTKHTFQILTKRPTRMKYYCDYSAKLSKGMPKNLWLGVSVEDQKTADERIPILLDIPASIRFLSCEPLLGAIKFNDLIMNWNAYDPRMFQINWVITGGESGPNARPVHPDWIRSLRDQCQEAGVPFFFKQWGEWAPNCLCDTKKPHKEIKRPSGSVGVMFRCGKKKAGSLLYGKEWKEFPVVP